MDKIEPETWIHGTSLTDLIGKGNRGGTGKKEAEDIREQNAQPMDTDNTVVKAKGGGVQGWVEVSKEGENRGYLYQCN